MNLKNCKLHYLEPKQFDIWDAFVEASPQSCIYGNSWYLQALQCDFKILVVQEKATIHVGIVLAKNRKGTYANPYLIKYLGIYFANFKGTTYNQETKRRRATEMLLTEIKKLPSFDYFFHPQFNSYLPFHHHHFDNRIRSSYWLNLKANSIEEIEANFHTKLRSELRFANQQGYSLVEKVDVNLLIDLCEKTFIQKGAKFPFQKSFLRDYFKQLAIREAIQTFGVQNGQGKMMAVIALLNYNGVSTLILSGFDKDLIARGANEWLLFNVIKKAKTHSDWFDFEGSMIQEIETFYRKFGGAFLPYLRIYKNSFKNRVYEQLKEWYRIFR